MLSSLLGSLKEQLFSKSFLLAALFPLVLFLAANGIMFRWHSTAVREWLEGFEELDDKVLVYAAVFGLLLAVAYFISILNGTLLELLEGKRAPIRWVAPLSYWWQHATVRKLEERYNATVVALGRISRHRDAWMRTLDDAAEQGSLRRTCAYPHNVFGAVGAERDVAHAYWLIAKVLFRRRLNQVVPIDHFEGAVAALVIVLQENSIGANTRASRALAKALRNLREAIVHSRDKLQFDRLQLYNRRQFSYPGKINPSDERSTNSLLAPTMLGNIGRTIRSYALTRYQLDLDIFWTRLQNSVQKAAADYYTVVQDAKLQLDSLVTLTWLAALFTVTWAVLLTFIYPSQTQLRIVLTVGPALTYSFYVLACNSYRVFADLMRSCVDLFRFDLLKDLHLPLPYGLEEERRLWLRLGDLTGYGEEQPFRYAHDGAA